MPHADDAAVPLEKALPHWKTQHFVAAHVQKKVAHRGRYFRFGAATSKCVLDTFLRTLATHGSYQIIEVRNGKTGKRELRYVRDKPADRPCPTSQICESHHEIPIAGNSPACVYNRDMPAEERAREKKNVRA